MVESVPHVTFAVRAAGYVASYTAASMRPRRYVHRRVLRAEHPPCSRHLIHGLVVLGQDVGDSSCIGEDLRVEW